MNLEMLQSAAASNQWVAIYPEIMLGMAALALLVLEIILPKERHSLIPTFAMIAQAAVLIGVLVNFNTAFLGEETFSGMLYHSLGGQVMRVFFLVSSLLVSFLGTLSLPKQKVPRVEFYHLILVITAALMLLAQSNHFVLLFVALETVTVGFYIMVSYFRDNPRTLEAGLKYLILGALSSSILLFGIVLLYGAGSTPSLPGHAVDPLNFTGLRVFLDANPDNFLARVGAALVIGGLAFKIGAVPFQIWIPDVYEGAPTPVTAFLAIASKAAGFAVLLSVTQKVFAPLQSMVVPLLTFMTVATILFGNFAALTQHNVKRLMGLSGVSHAGYLLIGVVTAVAQPSLASFATGAIYFYLFTYLFASFAVFGVMAHLAGCDDTDQDADHYANLAKEQPFLGAILAIGLGSLAGIPPLAGFIGKLLLFTAAFKAGLYSLLVVAVVGVVVSIYYYFGWIKAAFFPPWRVLSPDLPPAPVRTPVLMGARVTLTVLAVVSIILGFYQGPLGNWLGR